MKNRNHLRWSLVGRIRRNLKWLIKKSKCCCSQLLMGVFVLQAVVDILKTLPVSVYASLIEWIKKYSKNAKVCSCLRLHKLSTCFLLFPAFTSKSIYNFKNI